ncbi:uncharacterized protein Z520_08894 [Fonsecaea multimorphosa CBS 102226]|uniref:ER-bound oxygenase mpaB/mpaB'/Rubber oxygenase catalytic domain-containing protein n=1 Tax=Fonsecaea multimorphosa CBS 102226 TaxID=1442371 RepID=A0A0D2JPU5_9EURO|nr:uncharacterized protein Z520_08894 [Fonsecaea multimorphosa CBS 102226]KIX95377.1 hypothetical protein Z520_08894 [Fonsecaea multimorphosa CBS 102226]OAL21045.1 hypothetical protein AYO22_08329 [Fonsecaea multimorphosa]
MSTFSNESFSKLASISTQRLSGFSSFWSYYLLPAIVAYPFVCSALRFRRLKSLQAKYKYGTPEHPSYEGMTVKEAHDILKAVSDLEFPSLFEKGLQFALFRTYGIPTISELLVKTTQLSTEKNVPKRYADTGVLLGDMYGGEPTSDRCIDGYARLNYLHGHYIKQGKISNDDMLYTLSLFLNQPVEWINRYEWRQLSDLEICAMGVFHKAMGDGMEISFEKLPSYSTGWKDGLHFYRELDTWAKQYEKDCMVPHQKNYETAVQTRNLLLSMYPPFMKKVLTKVVSAPLDDRLRVAIMFDEAPPSYKSFFNGFMELRRLFLRYLALPKPTFMAKQMMTKEPDAKGRRYYVTWDTAPVYVKPTLWNRWGPGAMVHLVLGIPRPGDPGTYPEGFEISSTGPSAFVGKGSKEMEMTRERLKRERTGGCPFAVRRA